MDATYPLVFIIGFIIGALMILYLSGIGVITYTFKK